MLQVLSISSSFIFSVLSKIAYYYVSQLGLLACFESELISETVSPFRYFGRSK